MTESIIQPEPFREDFCMLDIIVEKIYSSTSSMSLSLKIISAFEFKWKLSNFVLSSLSIFLNTKTSFATTLNPLNPDNMFLVCFKLQIESF